MMNNKKSHFHKLFTYFFNFSLVSAISLSFFSNFSCSIQNIDKDINFISNIGEYRVDTNDGKQIFYIEYNSERTSQQIIFSDTNHDDCTFSYNFDEKTTDIDKQKFNDFFSCKRDDIFHNQFNIQRISQSKTDHFFAFFDFCITTPSGKQLIVPTLLKVIDGSFTDINKIFEDVTPYQTKDGFKADYLTDITRDIYKDIIDWDEYPNLFNDIYFVPNSPNDFDIKVDMYSLEYAGDVFVNDTILYRYKVIRQYPDSNGNSTYLIFDPEIMCSAPFISEFNSDIQHGVLIPKNQVTTIYDFDISSTIIGDYFVSGFDNLEHFYCDDDATSNSITISDNVTKIGNSFFWGNKKMTNISLNFGKNPKLKSIGDNFCYQCINLNCDFDFSALNNLNFIGNDFLFECINFNSRIIFPINLQTIGSNFLCSCVSFAQQLIIPNSVISIANDFMYKTDNFCESKGAQLILDCTSFPWDNGFNSEYNFATDNMTNNVFVEGFPVRVNKKISDDFINTFVPSYQNFPFRKFKFPG